MRKAVVLSILVFAGFCFSTSSVFGQTMIVQKYGQVPNTGYPSHPVVIRNVGPHELEVRVEWRGMKSEYVYTLHSYSDTTEAQLPSYVRLNVRAWAWVYNKNGKKERKEMQFFWYFDEVSGKPVFWFPMFK